MNMLLMMLHCLRLRILRKNWIEYWSKRYRVVRIYWAKANALLSWCCIKSKEWALKCVCNNIAQSLCSERWAGMREHMNPSVCVRVRVCVFICLYRFVLYCIRRCAGLQTVNWINFSNRCTILNFKCDIFCYGKWGNFLCEMLYCCINIEKKRKKIPKRFLIRALETMRNETRGNCSHSNSE